MVEGSSVMFKTPFSKVPVIRTWIFVRKIIRIKRNGGIDAIPLIFRVTGCWNKIILVKAKGLPVGLGSPDYRIFWIL